MDVSRRQWLAAAGLGGLVVAGAAGSSPASRATRAVPVAVTTPSRAGVVDTVMRVNDHWIGANAGPGDNGWARATYFSGLTTLYRAIHVPRYLAYAQSWAESWDYRLKAGPASQAPDNQCAGQAYFDLYAVAPDPHKIAAITASVESMIGGPDDPWSWVDALHMAMPPMVRVATARHDDAVLDTMWACYRNTRWERRLWDTGHNLWFRDETFLPPHGTTSPSGGPMFWSRGNGWAFAAHAKILQIRPDLNARWPAYASTFRAMASRLPALQRPDGFWNVDLLDAHDYPGPESSGTSLFLFGLATGIRLGLLSRDTYLPVALRAWHGLRTIAVQPDGTLGYVQGVGKQPSSSQPVTAMSTSDFGVGAFTSAGCALAALVR